MSEPHVKRRLVEQMTQEACLKPEWTNRIATSGNACFGWCGWRTPMIFSSDDLLLVIDGAIYNRKELGNVDHDAEFFASLYRRVGMEKALQVVNGDFSMALFDGKTNRLWLARDRFGVKPLYYVANSEFFAFGSQPRILLSLPGVSKELNRQFVALFASSHYRYIDNSPERSPYRNIAQLPAAHMLFINNKSISLKAYWSLKESPNISEPDAELAERYRELLLDSVSLRIQDARRPAFTLSGGMDSSSVLASAVHLTGEGQHAFSSIYEDKTYDESHEIQSMLPDKVKRWHPIYIGTPDLFELVEKMIALHGEPVATATWLSHYILCHEVGRQGFDSLFGGLGGDELNAGEYEYFFYYFADLQLKRQKRRLDNEVKRWIQYHDHPIYRKSVAVMEDGMARLVDFETAGKCLPDRRRLMRYAKALNPDFFDLSGFEPIMDHPFSGYLKNRTYQDIFRETAPCCLRAEDRQTIGFGLDHYLPFFDHRLVEYMFRIPGRLKIRDGVTKRLPREAMQGLLPEETRTRIKKTGWNAPAHAWFSGKILSQLEDLVHSATFRSRGIYDVSEVEKIMMEHKQIVSDNSLEDNHMMFLWQLLNLELWLSELSKW